MAKKQKTGISPTRTEDYSEWYQQVVKSADLAENSPVRGSMVIKPWGYSLWENIRTVLDREFKETGHQNAYFPLFIPLSFLEKEAEHVEGFAKECAVVTHHRLVEGPNGGLIPDGELEEPLVVRPTSETIIGEMFAKWVQSYRDLPLLINQWANVVRWEMRTRLFLRTAEFLWQEGHTAHETKEEAWDETRKMLDVYANFTENWMAMPVLVGEKSASERFPGAVSTLCIEAIMQDRKALQTGTSHFLGQNFAKSSNIQYQSREGQMEYAWTTSWGVSTRLIGALIMTHADDDGMIMPPKIAPAHVVILPIIRDEADEEKILNYCQKVADSLKNLPYHGRNVEVVIDRTKFNAGEKSWNWIRKGIPVRVEVGMRDIENNSLFVARRDKSPRDKESILKSDFPSRIVPMLDEIQNTLLTRARKRLDEHTYEIEDKDEFYRFFTPKNREKPEIHGGFVFAHWCESAKCEAKLKEDLSVTIRNIPFDSESYGDGKCVVCGAPAKKRVLFAKSY